MLSILVPLVVLLSSIVPDAATPTFLLKWGTRGSGDGQFWIPWDVATDASGNVYVTDFSTTSGRPHRVQVFSANGSFLRRWGREGIGAGQFDEPRGIAIDGSGTVYVCDTFNRRIQKFATDSTYLGQLFVPPGTAAAQPYDVAIDLSGNLYVADIANPSVVKLDPGGGFVARLGSGELSAPWSVAVDGAGMIYVADRTNHRIVKFGPTGANAGGWGTEGSGPGQFIWPRGVHVDAQGAIYVTDQIHRVQKFTSDGQFIYQFGTEGILDGQFEFPTGMTTVLSGSMMFLYVIDQESNRVQKFGDSSVPVTVTTWGRIKALYR